MTAAANQRTLELGPTTVRRRLGGIPLRTECANWPYCRAEPNATITPTNQGWGVRLFLTVFVGGIVAAGAYVGAGMTTGFPQAGLFIGAICCATLTLGVVAVSTVERVENHLKHRKYRPDVGDPRWSSHHETSSRSRCGVCNRAMQQLESIWVCAMCDRSFSHL